MLSGPRAMLYSTISWFPVRGSMIASGLAVYACIMAGLICVALVVRERHRRLMAARREKFLSRYGKQLMEMQRLKTERNLEEQRRGVFRDHNGDLLYGKDDDEL